MEVGTHYCPTITESEWKMQVSRCILSFLITICSGNMRKRPPDNNAIPCAQVKGGGRLNPFEERETQFEHVRRGSLLCTYYTHFLSLSRICKRVCGAS